LAFAGDDQAVNAVGEDHCHIVGRAVGRALEIGLKERLPSGGDLRSSEGGEAAVAVGGGVVRTSHGGEVRAVTAENALA
jgi:hypothetical protein